MTGIEWLPDVPSHWDVLRLKQACDVFPSNVDKKSVAGERTVMLCNYTDVYYNDRIGPDLDFMVATATDDQVDRFTLRAGDTIVTKDSETADDIAVSAFVPADLPGVVCGYHLSMVRPITPHCGAFVKRLFDSAYAKACVAVRANGLTRVALGQYDLDNLELPFPPPAEQAAIAAFLDRETAKIDELVEEQRQLIALLDEKRQAVISHAVTKGLNPDAPMNVSGGEWLDDLPAGWRLVRVKDVVESLGQGWSPQCDGEPVDDDSRWAVLKAGCVTGGTFDAWDNKALPADLIPRPDLAIRGGDLLVSRANTRELVGSAAVAERDYPKIMLCDKLYRVRVNAELCHVAFLRDFLATAVARALIERAATGASASMVNISQSSILDLPFPLPPVSEQMAILDFISGTSAALESLRSDALRAIALLLERRSALITAAVTGQIDVRALAPTEAP